MNELKELMSRKKGTDKGGGGGGGDAGAPAPAEDMDWPQTANAYELKAQIGQGAFAKVWQARCLEKNADVAVKIMELDNLTSSLDDIYQEVRVMLLSKNPSVLRAYACFVVRRSLWLVMPLMRKGSCLRIMKVLKRVGLGEGMKEEWIAAILKSTLIGLEYFHQQGKLHRDIKASNLLMDSDGSVMISDFGVAGWLPTGGQDRREGERRTFVGTPCWMAPEVMEQTSSYDEKADIWSFGITALELAKGYAPYARLQPMKVLLMTIQNPPPSLKTYEDYQRTKSKFSRHFREIITLCLQKNASLRPSASTLLGKTFFKRAPPNSFLVKDLLEAVPIPDTCENSNGPGAAPGDTRQQQKDLENIQHEQQQEIQKQQLKEAAAASAEAGSDATESSSAAGASASGASATAAGTEAAAAPTTDPAGAPAPAARIKRLMEMEGARPGGGSFVKGATWVFDDEEDEPADAAPAAPAAGASDAPATADAPAPAGAPATGAPAAAAGGGEDMSGFEAFASEYAKMDIKGEDGKTPNEEGGDAPGGGEPGAAK